jgi:transcription antitermination factor NusG
MKRPLLDSAQVEKDWLVIYTIPKNENKVYSELLKRGIDAYLPMRSVVRQWSDRKKKIQVPLLPNYVFLKPSRQKMWSVVGITGVVRYVSFEGKPAIVRQKEIDVIKKIQQSNYTVHDDEKCAIGDRMRITAGPLAGLEGVLYQKKGGDRFCIELESISKSIAVEVPTHLLVKVR